MDRKFFILANPASGSYRIGRVLRDVISFLEAKKLPHHVFETTAVSRGTETVRKNLDNSFTDLVIVGGDGTLNEAINGLDFDIPVSIIPAGTGDDYIKALDFPANFKDQLGLITEGAVQKVDLGICNDRKFLNGLGIGFDGQIVADMQQKTVRFLSGQAKYYYHVLQILSTYKTRQVSGDLDGATFSQDVMALTIAKGTTFGGGFKLTPHGDVCDGQLAICELGDISPIRRYLNILKLQGGTHDTVKGVKLYKAKELTVNENPLLEAHIDGEYMGKPPFNIKVLPKALRIRVQPRNNI